MQKAKYFIKLKKCIYEETSQNTFFCKRQLQRKQRAQNIKPLKNSIKASIKTTKEDKKNDFTKINSQFDSCELYTIFLFFANSQQTNIIRIFIQQQLKQRPQQFLNNVIKRDKIQIKSRSSTLRLHELSEITQDKGHPNLSIVLKQSDQHLVIMIQKYKQVKPSSLQNLISRCTPKQQVTWQHLLAYMEQQIQLEDKVNKMKLSKPSIIDVAYYPNPDEHLQQRISDIIHYIKKKSTNYIKFITKADFLGYKLLVVVLEREAIFYDCNEKAILKCLNFKYSNVRQKMLTSYEIKQKSCDIKISKIFKTKGSQVVSLKHFGNNQQADKVNPISRRTDQNACSPSLKSRKNTNQTDELKNVLNVRSSKLEESVSVCSQVFDNVQQRARRTTTMMDYQSVALLNRSLTKHSKKKDQAAKKEYIKVRSNDTATILKLVTDSKIEGSIETIKAYKNSIESFQKFVQIDKSKVERQKQLLDQIKLPSGLNIKFDYKKSIKQMKNKGKQLEQKKKILERGNQSKSGSKYNFSEGSYQNKKFKTQMRSRPKSKFAQKIVKQQENQLQNSDQEKNTQIFRFNNQIQADAFISLQKKMLQVQSVSFYQNYMLVSLMNCQLRLYSFKKSIHSFSQEMIFQKNYPSVVSYVQIYKSQVRKLCNICIVLSKFSAQTHTGASFPVQKNSSNVLGNNLNIRATNLGLQKKDTEIIVYQLSSDMQIQKQSYSTFLSYSPILINMLPLGIGGFIQSGYFFLVELNCTSRNKSEIKAIDTSLRDPNSGKKVSISCMKCHKNLVNLFIGCKNGQVFIYDRLAENVRIKNKISNHQILQINFVNDGNQVLFWDYSGKVGVFNADNLTISHISSIISQPNSDSIGGGRRLWGMMQFFIENQFLVYGDRVIELISLTQNAQKKFNLEKPMKIFNRRLSIKNRHSQPHVQKKLKNQTQTVPTQSVAPTGKRIHNYFNTSQSLIMVTCQGEIMIYDKNVSYVGSYFTLNYATLTQCLNCPSIKYLYLLYQNNDMQVANIYTQEQLINITNVRLQVYDIFFCHSSVYFCGYLSNRKFQLHIYAYPNQNFNGGSKNPANTQPLISVKLYNLIMDIPSSTNDQQSKLSKISKNTQSSYGTLGSIGNAVEIQIKFYKGSMIIIDYKKVQVLFLYKKSYTRNCIIRCNQYMSKIQKKQENTLNFQNRDQLSLIVNTFIDLQTGKLTLLMRNYTIMVIGLDNKVVNHIYLLPVNKILLNLNESRIKKQQEKLKMLEESKNPKSNKNSHKNTPTNQQESQIMIQPIEHYYQHLQNTVYVTWKVSEQSSQLQQGKGDKYLYSILKLENKQQQQQSPFIQQTSVLHLIKTEPNPHLHPQMHHAHHTSTHMHKLKTEQKLSIVSKVEEQWISCPFLIGHSLLTMSKDETYFNLYRIKKKVNKQKSIHKYSIQNKSSFPENQTQKPEKRSQVNVILGQKQAQIQYYCIQPE